MLRNSGLLCCLAASLGFAQLDSNSVTVSSYRNATTATPDQAIYGISVTTDIAAGLDDVVAVLRPLGLTSSNLTGVSSSQFFLSGLSNTVQTQLVWSFNWPTSLAKTKDSLAMLTTLQKSIGQLKPGWSFSFSFYSQSSSQPGACPGADLMADARAQAQKLADTAGLTLGSVLALSGSTTSSCSLTVKFALLRY